MHFSSWHSWFRCSVCHCLQCLSSLNQRVNQWVKKTFFLSKFVSTRSCIIINRSQMYPSEKITKHLTVKYPFFLLTTSLSGEKKWRVTCRLEVTSEQKRLRKTHSMNLPLRWNYEKCAGCSSLWDFKFWSKYLLLCQCTICPGIFNPEWTHSEHIGAGRDAKVNEFFTAEERFLPWCKI